MVDGALEDAVKEEGLLSALRVLKASLNTGRGIDGRDDKFYGYAQIKPEILQGSDPQRPRGVLCAARNLERFYRPLAALLWMSTRVLRALFS